MRIATGCMMIKTEVFQHLEKPYFKTVDEEPDAEVILKLVTDDLYFCKKVTDAGFKILADGAILCTHWDYRTDPPTPYQLPPDSYPLKEESKVA